MATSKKTKPAEVVEKTVDEAKEPVRDAKKAEKAEKPVKKVEQTHSAFRLKQILQKRGKK